ncbi:MAG: class I SAM-dependent methyltransferase [Planctomycetes bacterium]|nr:class I SAM-dependent methyltransferase [Planctomycetota bacterium]
MACRRCGSLNVELFLDLGEQPHCNRLIAATEAAIQEPCYPLRVGFCHDCTLVQIDHTIPKEQMFAEYPYVSGTTRTLVKHFHDTAARLVHRYELTRSDLVVDIGSNDGTWLAGYRPFSIRVLGVEAAANIAEIANENGIRTWNQFFNEETADEIVGKEGHARLITAAGVFFHLEELHSVVRGVARLLTDDGVLCVQAIYLGGMLDNLAFDQIYHEHLCYYTLRSLEALLKQHGLEVFDVDLQPIHGGSLEVHVGKPGAHRVEPQVEAFHRMEEERHYGRFETYQDFARQVWQLRDKLLGRLNRYADEGKTVFAYGAPAKGATLLNSFGIRTRLVQKAVEKNPMKIGYLIPGTRIPIVDERASERPDAYLMLAWNFLEEFIEKERTYLESGGEFVVPIPELRLITGADLPAAPVLVAR